MAKKSITKGVIKDVVIVVVGVMVIWLGLQAVFGTNPFYVVASGSMVPALEVYDVLIVQGREPFENVKTGDIIVFDRPSDQNRVIVHRVVSVIDEDPRTLRTKGDANSASIPGTDFPITEKEYIGKVAYVLPQVGYVTQMLQPPVNYIIIAAVVGIMIAKQMVKRKKERELPFSDPPESEDADAAGEPPEGWTGDPPNLDMKDSEYSEHAADDIPEETRDDPADEEHDGKTGGKKE